MEIVGEATLRISALTRDLKRTVQRSVGDALKGITVPQQNALTQLQRDLNKGELDLAKASDAHTKAVREAQSAEKDLADLRKDESATAEQLADAESRHKRALLEVRVAVDKLAVAEEKHRALQDKLRRGNLDQERSHRRLASSLGGLTKAYGGLLGGIGKTVAGGSKIALLGAAAGGAVAGATSLAISLGALAAAAAQAAGAAGLLPAVLAGKWAILGTAKLALTGFEDALKAVASGDAAKLDEALKDMAPNARLFVREIAKAKPAFDAMRLDVQQRAFAGLAGSIQPLAERYLPQADALFTGIAASMNQAARETVRMALAGDALRSTQLTVAQLQVAAGNLAPAFAPAVRAIMDVVSVGSTFLPAMTSQFSAALQGVSARIHEMAANGELEAFFQRALDTISQLGRIAGNVGGIFSGVFNAAKSAGGGLLTNLEQLTESMSRFVNSAAGQSALTGFFQAMHVIMQALSPVLLQVVSIIGTQLAPIIANLAATILPAILPALQAFGRLLAAAAPLISLVADVLATLFEAFAPLIDLFAQAIQEAMPQLQPAFQAIAEALVQLVQAAMPLVPIFVQLLAALLPIVAPLVQLVAAILPPLISLIQALMPVIMAAAQTFVAFAPILISIAQVILGVLIPPIRLILTVVGAVVRAAMAVFTFFANGIRAGVQKIIGFFGMIGGIVGRVVGFFRNIRDGALRQAINLVNWVKGLPGRILGALGGLAGQMLNAGIQAIQGLLNGLKNAAGAVIDWIKGLAGDLIDSVLGMFGISSPSKVFHGIGVNLGRGLVTGIQAVSPAVLEAATAMADQVNRSVQITPTVDPAAGILAALQPAPAGVTPAGGEGANAEDVAEALAEKIADMQVVISQTAVTNAVNRRNRANARR